MKIRGSVVGFFYFSSSGGGYIQCKGVPYTLFFNMVSTISSSMKHGFSSKKANLINADILETREPLY